MIGFQTPPINQGQIVEVSYMFACAAMIKRIHDRSDLSTSYEIADINDDDSSWYESYQPCNGAPPIDAARWRSISVDRVEAIIEELGGAS